VFLFAVEQQVPVNWTVGAISHDGRHNASAGKVVWGPFYDAQVRVLVLELTPPAGAIARVQLTGSGTFNGVTIATTGLAFLDATPPPSGTVVRSLPATYRPGQTVMLTNHVSPEAGVGTYAVEESLMVGWQLIEANELGVLLTGQRLRWGPFFDEQARVMVARLQVPAEASGTVPFTGTAWFGATSVIIGGAASIAQAPLGSGTVTRTLPSGYRPGQSFTVTNYVQPGAGTAFVVVQETPPAGWTVANPSHSGSWNAGLGLIKWGPFVEDTALTLTYPLTPPVQADGVAVFSGDGTFDQATVATGGATNLSRQRADSGTLTRVLPACYVPGVTFMVTNQVAPEQDVTAYGVIETFPAGWTVADPGIGSVNTNLNRLSWRPFFDNQARTLTYSITPSLTSTNYAAFSGNATFGSLVVSNAATLAPCVSSRGAAMRTLPAYFCPSIGSDVFLAVTPGSGVAIYFVEEVLPAGWQPSQISGGGAYDTQSGKLKWGPYLDDQPRTLAYQAMPPAQTSPQAAFAGIAYFDGQPVTIGGATNLPRNLPPVLTPPTGQFILVLPA
jgi:hypothetical protein